MPGLESFWTALESVPGRRAVSSEWQRQLAGCYRWAKPFLRQAGTLAAALALDDGEPWEVRRTSRGDVAIDPRGGPPRAIGKGCLEIWELDSTCVVKSIGNALRGSRAAPSYEDDVRWSIGDVQWEGEPRYGFVALFGPDDDPDTRLRSLAAEVPQPFLVAVARTAYLRETTRTHIEKGEGVLLDLSVALGRGRPGAFTLVGTARAAIAGTAPAQRRLRGRAADPASTPLGRKILHALGSRGVFGKEAVEKPTAEKLATWCGCKAGTKFRGMLSALSRAGYIDNGKHHDSAGGYFLTDKGRRHWQSVQKHPPRSAVVRRGLPRR